jgi:hypothetical protein
MEISRVQVDEIFASSDHQADVLVKLYRLVYPDWDNIKKLHGWPKCGKALADYIAKAFMAFDRKHHPKVMPGGLWMNNGFSTLDNDYLGPWEVDPSKGEPEYTQQAQA